MLTFGLLPQVSQKPCISDLRLLCFVVGRFIGGFIDAMQLANVLGAGSQH